MKIVKLTAENFKKLTAVEIKPDGNMVVISGMNEAGKSSVLDAIEAALCGGRKLPKDPIKKGEHRASVEIDMGDYIVTRKFLGSNSTLTVKTKGDVPSKITSPQAFLDKIVGELSFDPLQFKEKTSIEQRAIVLRFLGLDLNSFDSKIKQLKESRSEIRASKERATVQAEAIAFTPNLPPTEVSTQELLAEIQRVAAENSRIAEAQTQKQILTSQLNSDVQQTNETYNEIIRLTEKYNKQKAGCEQLRLKINAIPDEALLSKDEAEKKLVTQDKINEAIRNNLSKKEIERSIENLTEQYSNIGIEIKQIEEAKAKKMAEVEMPVPGLTVGIDGLYHNNIPFEQVNDAKKLEICVAISMALNPNLKVIRINGNDLDRNSLAIIGRLVADKDYQIWVEKISEDKNFGFYIEEGNLIKPNTAEE